MLKLKLWANPNITWNTRSSRRTRRAWKTRSMRALPCSAHWWFIAAVGRTRHLKAHNTQLKREKTHFCSILLHDANYMFSAVFSVVDRNAGNVTWLGDCTFPSFSFSCNRLLFMLIKSWQVNKQVPALINVSDFPVELTVTQSLFNQAWSLIIILLLLLTTCRHLIACRQTSLKDSFKAVDSRLCTGMQECLSAARM